MAAAMAAFAIITYAGCTLTGIQIHGFFAGIGIFFLLLMMLLPLLLYWYQKQRFGLVDAALLILWAWLESYLIPDLLRVAARLRMPLQDQLFGDIDRRLGINIQSIQLWAAHHWLGHLLNLSYAAVNILIPLSVLLPLIFRKPEYVRRLVVANLVCFAIGIPLFALLPAIGPWRYFDSAPTQLQYTFCEAPFLGLRAPGLYVLTTQPAGIICFPSFHVVWAIVCGATLWCFRYFRPIIVLLCAMIVISTMTTGWHYFTDVLGGLVLSVISLLAAHALVR